MRNVVSVLGGRDEFFVARRVVVYGRLVQVVLGDEAVGTWRVLDRVIDSADFVEVLAMLIPGPGD